MVLNLVRRESAEIQPFCFSQKATLRHHGGDTNSLHSTFQVFLPCAFPWTLLGVSVVIVVYSLSMYKKFIMHRSMNVEENNEHALHISTNLSGTHEDDRLPSEINAAWLLCHGHKTMSHHL